MYATAQYVFPVAVLEVSPTSGIVTEHTNGTRRGRRKKEAEGKMYQMHKRSGTPRFSVFPVFSSTFTVKTHFGGPLTSCIQSCGIALKRTNLMVIVQFRVAHLLYETLTKFTTGYACTTRSGHANELSIFRSTMHLCTTHALTQSHHHTSFLLVVMRLRRDNRKFPKNQPFSKNQPFFRGSSPNKSA